MFGYFYCNIPLDISANLRSTLFCNKAAKTTYINVLTIGKAFFHLLNIVSKVTSTSTFGMPVFSEILLIRSDFLISFVY